MGLYKLLITEDEAIIRRGLVSTINWESMGFTVIADASNGKKALQCIEEEEPDVLLTDIRMPVMDGLELMSRVSKEHPRVRMVVLSGYGDFSYAQHAISCGALAYVLKPSKTGEIQAAFQKVKAVLDGRVDITPSPSPVKTGLHSIDPVIQRVEAYLDQNFSEKITLDNVAEIAYMNPSYFSTFFKQKTGRSFKDYLTALRMEKARELALTSSLKGYHIAVLVGYDDARYFAKLFKETYGKSVSEMRKEQEG